jgi:hypothetical protein
MVQNMSRLLSRPDPILLARASLDEVRAAIGALARVDSVAAESLDALFARFAGSLAAPSAREGDRKRFVDLVRRTVSAPAFRSSKAARSLRERWLGYAIVVDRLLAAAATRDPEAVLRRAHVKEVLALMPRTGGVPQRHILSTLGLKAANLVRILDLMERNGLIVREERGRMNLVARGPAAPPIPGGGTILGPKRFMVEATPPVPVPA